MCVWETQELKYTLKRLIGEIFEVRSERRKLGSVKLIINKDSPNNGRYVANLYDVPTLTYGDSAQEAVDASFTKLDAKREERKQTALAQRQSLIERRRLLNTSPQNRVVHDDPIIGPLVDIRVPVRNKDT